MVALTATLMTRVVCAAPAEVSVELRATGYAPGDLIEQVVSVQLPAGAKLDRATLPVPGRVFDWLELRAVNDDCAAAVRVCTLRLRYQIFAVPPVPTALSLPSLGLALLGVPATPRVQVPEAPFVLAPTLVAPEEVAWLTPLRAPAPVAPSRTRALLLAALCVAGTLCAGLWALWIDDRLPWLPRRPGPFTLLARRLRGLQRADHGVLARECLRAMNETAGETLYACSLVRLFERAPALTPLRTDFERFAAAAWAFVYGTGAPPSASEVSSLVQAAADRERRR